MNEYERQQALTPKAWMFTVGGEWKEVLAPWKGTSPDEWLRANVGRLIWNSDEDPSDPANPHDRWNGPWVWVFEVRGEHHSSDPRFRLAAAVLAQGSVSYDEDDAYIVGEAGCVLLIQGYPALPGFVRYWSNFVRFHPGTKDRPKPTDAVNAPTIDPRLFIPPSLVTLSVRESNAD